MHGFSGPSASWHERPAVAGCAFCEIVVAAPAEEQASRKRRLLKGPEEFREARVDRPKANGK